MPDHLKQEFSPENLHKWADIVFHSGTDLNRSLHGYAHQWEKDLAKLKPEDPLTGKLGCWPIERLK